MHSFFGNSFFLHFSIEFAPQMKTRCLTIEERACIIGMPQGGAKGVEIVAALGHLKSTVSTVLKNLSVVGVWSTQNQLDNRKNYESRVLGL
jgi:hypothetical protein